jgi:hypothetical protein
MSQLIPAFDLVWLFSDFPDRFKSQFNTLVGYLVDLKRPEPVQLLVKCQFMITWFVLAKHFIDF